MVCCPQKNILTFSSFANCIKNNKNTEESNLTCHTCTHLFGYLFRYICMHAYILYIKEYLLQGLVFHENITELLCIYMHLLSL